MRTAPYGGPQREEKEEEGRGGGAAAAGVRWQAAGQRGPIQGPHTFLPWSEWTSLGQISKTGGIGKNTGVQHIPL